MRKASLLAKISLEYWRHHTKRFFTLMTVLVLGVSAVCCTALLIRSEKQALLEEELRLLGDYDIIACRISDSTAERLRCEEGVEKLGKYYELGCVQNASGTKAFAAAFADSESEKLYHMTCSKGRYPENEDEVVLDHRTAKSMGVSPYPGERIELSFCGDQGELISTKEYTVSGIIESSSAVVMGGWYRYPNEMGEGVYDMPSVFFYGGRSDTVTAFMQTDDSTKTTDLIGRILALPDTGITYEQISSPNGRRFAYAYILGISDTLWQNGEPTLGDVDSSMQSGSTVKDFYSDVLMPIFTCMAFLIVVISVVGIARNVLRDKQECFAVLSSLGLGPNELRLYILLDLMSVGVLCAAVGAGLGILLHIGMISALNSGFDLKLSYGFGCSDYVDAVTFDPFALAAGTILLCLLAAVLLSLISLRGRTPVELYSETGRPKLRRRRPARTRRGMISKSLRLGNAGVAVISAVMMSSALFGYTYFRALADKENSELEFEKEEAGLGEWDYKAERSDSIMSYSFGIENRHDCGIRQIDFEELRRQPFVKKAFGKIADRSTRLSFREGSLDLDMLRALRFFDLRQFAEEEPDNELAAADKEAEEAMISAIGYNSSELVYALPTVGFYDDELEELEPYVMEGSIDLEKLGAGEEVLLVMTKTGYQSFSPLFHAGDELPLSDIVLNDEEEGYDFGAFDPSKFAEPVYKKQVTTPEGDRVELTSYAFGKRRDIPVRVGAVVALDMEQYKKYMTPASQNEYGMNAFCSVKAFEAWGLKNRNLTDVCFALDSERSVDEADSFWYSMISRSKGMTGHSTSEIAAGMNRGTRKIMSIYYCMMVILTLIAAVTIAIILYTDIRMRSSRIAVLRASGMSLRQLASSLVVSNIVYPIVGTAFAFLPLWGCQRFFESVRGKLESGEWVWEEHQWVSDVPYWKDLFDYSPYRAAAFIFAVCVVIMLAVTLPQTALLKKQEIAGELERSSF